MLARRIDLNSRFGESVIIGNPEMREQMPRKLRPLQMVYRTEQVRQLEAQLREWGLNLDDVEYHGAEFEKNMCPSTSFESESGILYNRRTGVSIPVILDWACEWNCGPEQWQGRAEIGLHTCKPAYFFVGLTPDKIEALR